MPKKKKIKKEETLSINFLADKREDRFRKGLWQFFIDHSRLLPDGRFEIIIFAKSESDLWKRAEARINGTYKVTTEEKIRGKKSVTEMHLLKIDRDKIQKSFEIIKKENRFFDGLIYKIYSLTRKYVLKIK